MKKLKNEELDRLTIEDFKKSEKQPICILLDNVRSMNNVGSAFRTSDAFLVEKIYLGGITAKPPHRDIHKTALGATESVDWEHVEDLKLKVQELQNRGYKVYAVEQVDTSIMLNDFIPLQGEKYCLIFGNEVFGVADELIEVVDGCIEIPQYGTKHSLNISVSMGVVIWDVISKMNK
jgi:tRNA G18 (ribose-2'-O)-methylase SpoU